LEEGRLKLRADEARVFKALLEKNEPTDLADLSGELALNESSLAPLIHSLVSRKLAVLTEKELVSSSLTPEGDKYAQSGLPERRLLKTILGSNGKAILAAARSLSHLTEGETQIGLGWARKKGWIKLERVGTESVLTASSDYPEGEDERLLREHSEHTPAPTELLSEATRVTLQSLQNRGLLTISPRIVRSVELTAFGRKAGLKGFEVVEEAGKLTSRLLRSGEWKQALLREYDISAPPPAIYPGRKHPYLAFLDEVRQLLLEMGFSEDEGPYVETEFWDFDVLFQAQDHPAREIHDAYRLKQPTDGRLPDEKLVRGIKKAHESAWGYKWSAEIARRLILRTQTTAVSVRHLYTHHHSPLKMFCLSRNFRPDVLDPTHSMEFFQCEGIAMGKGLNFRDLLGFFKEFAHKLGLEEVRFRPSYFPFTEPSVEGFVRHPTLGWVEMLPGGLFRPEFLKPLGIRDPVLAWGIGIDRIAMTALGVDDIRELYGRSLQTLRDTNLRWSLCRQ
jgi:phenylalanyl-tRNA synthetase alpha chain